MKNNLFKIMILLIILFFLTSSFFALKVYFTIQEKGVYESKNIESDLFSAFIYAIGPIIISIIGFRKKLFKK